jgi:hypothetical protein
MSRAIAITKRQTLSLHSWHRHFSLIAARQQLCGVGTINFVNALSLA